MALNFPDAPVSGQVYDKYYWNDTLGVWSLVNSIDELALDDVADITITTPADGEVLAYNSGTWENQAVAASGANPHPFTMIG